jgi:oligopeptide/dipeptide ABC transporter ATP-binding protein
MSTSSHRNRRQDAGSVADALLKVEDLSICFSTSHGTAMVVVDVSFEVRAGETFGIVGESGSGKSMSLRALLGLVPSPGRVIGGRAFWRGETNLIGLAAREQRFVRGAEIAMIFQDPLVSLDPLYTVGNQLVETLRQRAGCSRSDARERAAFLLERVGIPAPRQRLGAYPHEMSGGMRQRVMIALAIACGPSLLLADEPTTALDVTIQDQILTLLGEIQDESDMAIVLVSHDLGVIAQSCDRVAVMYAGRIMEAGTVDEVLETPRHPYTVALLASAPKMAGEGRLSQLETIGGQPPNIAEKSAGCSFAPRCRYVRDECATVPMVLDRPLGGHGSACPFVNAGDA